MGCETGNCPIGRIEIASFPVVPTQHHAFLILTRNVGMENQEYIIYRGGPEFDNKGRRNEYRDQSGGLIEFISPVGLRESDDNDPDEDKYGLLITHRYFGRDDNYDWRKHRRNASENIKTLAEGSRYNNFDVRMTNLLKKIALLGQDYDPYHIFSSDTDNSNATVYSMLVALGLDTSEPFGASNFPGWGHNLLADEDF